MATVATTDDESVFDKRSKKNGVVASGSATSPDFGEQQRYCIPVLKQRLCAQSGECDLYVISLKSD